MIGRRYATALAVAAALLLAIGCDVQNQPAVTQEEAITRVVARANDTFGQLPPGARLTKKAEKEKVTCGDGRIDTRTFVEYVYTIDYPDGWPVEESMATLATYWEKAGYTTVRDDRASRDFPELVVENPADGFRVGYLVAHDGGKAFPTLRSSSPCVNQP
jgi:hypothetical protein